MRDDERFKKWCHWLETIREDMHRLYFYRYIFEGVVKIANDNDRLDRQSPFWGFFARIYGDSVVMGIRRQLKTQSDSISLDKLLREIADTPELVTRSDFYKIYNVSSSPIIERIRCDTFNLYTEPDSPHIDAERVKKDIQLLEEICESVEKYADRRIAHWDKREPGLGLDFSTIFESLELIGKLVKRYYMLLFAAELELLPPSDDPVFDIFQEPWLVPLPLSASYEHA